MTNPRTRSVLDGGPVTKKTTDKDGQTTITVWVRAISPLMAKIADYTSYVATGAAAIASFSGAVMLEDAAIAGSLAMLALPVPAFFASKFITYRAFARTKPVVFTPETVAYTRFLRERVFDTNLPVKFVLHTHPRVKIEADKIELREAKRTVRWYTQRLKPYYQNSHLLVLEYMGQPNIIMSIYNQQKAQEIVARLTAVSEVIGGYGGSHRGTATSPASDWGAQAGGLSTRHERSVS